MSSPTLVLGLGNRLMMDDGIGVAVVEALARQQGSADSQVRYEVGETDFDYCLALAAECESLVVVDAAQAGRRPGEVFLLPLRELGARGRGLSMHHLHFLDGLYHLNAMDQGVLIGIEPCQIDVHLGLSPVLTAGFADIVGAVERHIRAMKEP
jgi:hydrogenase maturation protease